MNCLSQHNTYVIFYVVVVVSKIPPEPPAGLTVESLRFEVATIDCLSPGLRLPRSGYPGAGSQGQAAAKQVIFDQL